MCFHTPILKFVKTMHKLFIIVVDCCRPARDISSSILIILICSIFPNVKLIFNVCLVLLISKSFLFGWTNFKCVWFSVYFFLYYLVLWIFLVFMVIRWNFIYNFAEWFKLIFSIIFGYICDFTSNRKLVSVPWTEIELFFFAHRPGIRS